MAGRRWSLCWVLLVGCAEDLPGPTLTDLRQPTGLALAPQGRWLYVSNGNWDLLEAGGSVVVLDLDPVARALDQPPPPGTALSRTRPCRRVADQAVLECDPEALVVPGAGVALGSAVGNLALDQPSGPDGRTRMLTIQRAPPAVVWLEVEATTEGPRLDCGQDRGGRCDRAHTIEGAVDGRNLALPGEPARVVVDPQAGRFAFVPHLLGGALSLIALDGEFGPELVDVETDFFRADPFDGTEFAGGFGVAARPCHPDAPPRSSHDCTRPLLYSTNRFFPSVRRFTVAPGLNVVVPGGESSLPALNPEQVQSQPYMGDLVVEDPGRDDRMLVVQTTPAGLVRVDTRLGPEGEPVDAIIGMEAVCDNPNLVAVHRPVGQESLALVSCYDDGKLAIVGLGSFRLLRLVDLGPGTQEIAIDERRGWAWVSNTREDSISVVDLNRRAPTFLEEIARIGLGKQRSASGSSGR